MDAGVGNLADAGTSAPLDRKADRRPGRDSGGGRAARRAAAGRAGRPGWRRSCSWKAREPIELLPARAPARRSASARSDFGQRARPARLCERARCCASKRGERRRRWRTRPRGRRPAPGAPAPGLARSASPRATSARRPAVRARISGKAAASSERTWTTSSSDAGLDQRQRRRPARHRLQRRGQADDRRLALGEPRALLGAAGPRSAAMRRFGGGDVGLGRLDPRRQRLASPRGRARPRWSRVRACRIERLILRRCALGRLAPRLGHGASASAGRRSLRRGGRRRGRGRSGREASRQAHALILRDDRDGSQGCSSRGTVARRAWPGRAGAARSPCRRRAAGRPPARSASPKPSAPPIRKRASRLPSSRQRSSLAGQVQRAKLLAFLVEQDGDAALGRRRQPCRRSRAAR